MKANKIKILLLFIFLFIILTAVSGRTDWELDIGINYNLVIFYFLIALVFIHKIFQKKKIIFLPNNKNIKIIFFLFAISLLIITMLRDGLVNTYYLFIILSFILVITFNQLLYKVMIKDALLVFLVAMFVLMITNLYFHYLKTGNFILFSGVRTFEYRLSGIFGAGLAGALAGLSAILPIIIYLTGEKKHKVFLTLSFLLAWFIMFLADNRTSMITCLVIYFLIFLQFSKKNIKAKIFFLVIGMCMYIFLEFYLTSTSGGDYIKQDTDYRELIWFFGIDQIFQSPILGYGKQNPFATSNIAIQAIGQYNIGDPHNAYLFYILKNGIIVSFFFFWFTLKYFLFIYKNVRGSKYLIFLSIPIYWLMVGLTGGDYFNFNLNFSSIVFGISIFGILNHPDLQELYKLKPLIKKKNN